MTRFKTRWKGMHRRARVVFLAVFAVVFIVVALLLFSEELNLDAVLRRVKYPGAAGDYGLCALAARGVDYVPFGDGFLEASVGGVSLYSEKGEELMNMAKTMSTPRLCASRSLALAYDVGGTSVIAIKAPRQSPFEFSADAPIVDADVCENGAFCLSLLGTGYKTILEVYDHNQKIAYRYYSSSHYMPVCALSPNARYFAAVSMGQTDGMYASTATLFRTDSEEVFSTVPLMGELIYDLTFTDAKTLTAVGEGGLTRFSVDGTVLGAYDFDGKHLKHYDFGGDGFTSLAMNMYKAGDHYAVITVDGGGEELGRVQLEEKILDISASGAYLAVLSSSGLTIYDRELSGYAQTTDTRGASRILMNTDGSVRLIGSGSAVLYIP